MALGRVDVDEMLREMSSTQVSEWMAFSQLEPWGFQADLYGHALVASVFANANRGKNQRAFTPADFLPKEEEPVEGDRDFITALKAYFKGRAHGSSK